MRFPGIFFGPVGLPGASKTTEAMTGKLRILCALILAAALTAPGITRAAERIVLRNGATLDGNIRTQNRQVIVIDTKAGRQTIAKSDVVRVMFGMPDPEDEEKKAREKEAAAKLAREQEEEKRRAVQESALRQEEEMRAVAARAEEKDRQTREAAAAQKAREEEAAGKKGTEDKAVANRSMNPDNANDNAAENKRREEEKAALVRKSEEAAAKSNKAATGDADKTPKEEKKTADKAEEKKPVREREVSGVSPGTAAFYSMLLPGLGQMYADRTFTGGLYLALAAGALYGAYNENRMYLLSRKDYEQYNNPYNNSTLTLTVLGIQTPTTSAASAASDPLTSSYLSSSEYETKRKDVEQHFQARNNLAYGVLAIYLWSILDAYLFTSSSGATAEAAPGEQQTVRFFAAPMPMQRLSARDKGVTVGMSFQL